MEVWDPLQLPRTHSPVPGPHHCGRSEREFPTSIKKRLLKKKLAVYFNWVSKIATIGDWPKIVSGQREKGNSKSVPTGCVRRRGGDSRATPGQTEATGAFQLPGESVGCLSLLLRREGGEKQIKNTERDILGSKKEEKKLLTRPSSLSGGPNWWWKRELGVPGKHIILLSKANHRPP